MLQTRICDILGVTHPIVLGGMGGGHTAAPLVAAVSNAGGFGTLGVTGFSAASVQEQIPAIRAATDKPFGVNFLLFLIQEAALTAALESCPPVVSFAWPRPDQDLLTYVKDKTDSVRFARITWLQVLWTAMPFLQGALLKLRIRECRRKKSQNPS